MDYDRTITWSFSYDASLTIQDDGLTVPTVDGTVSGNWDLTDVTTYETLGCSSTVTQSAAVSVNLVGAGTAYVIPRGDGTLILNVLLPTQTNLTGMTTYQGTGDCGGGDPSELVLRAPEYIGSGTPSASTFSGSEAVDHSYFYLPTREYPELVMSWSLRLVRR
jgi:hypothetical protein